MVDKPKRASEYKSEQVELVRATCLYVATKLGDLMDDLVVIGGLAPSLLIGRGWFHWAAAPAHQDVKIAPIMSQSVESYDGETVLQDPMRFWRRGTGRRVLVQCAFPSKHMIRHKACDEFDKSSLVWHTLDPRTSIWGVEGA